MRSIAVLSALFLASPALADETEKLAEYERISTNMVRLAERNSWDGVELNFQELLDGKHEIRGGEWIIGAQAARKQGDVGLVIERLEQAIEAGEDDQAKVWMTTILENYRPVALQAKASTPFGTSNRPFNPDYVVTIDRAAAQIDKNGRFEGWLPHWSYQLGDEAFELEPGDEVFALDVRKIEAPAPEPEPPAADDAVAVSLPTEPMPDKAGLGWVRIPLLGGAGVTAGLAGAYYLAGNQRHRAWETSTNVDEAITLRHEANTYAQWSAIAAGATVALGVTGIAIPSKKKTRSTP